MSLISIPKPKHGNLVDADVYLAPKPAQAQNTLNHV